MDFTPVESSTIEGVSYDDALEFLYVRFKSGPMWLYQGVGQNVFEDFMRAKSRGSYFAKRIKPCFKADPYEDPNVHQETDAHGIAITKQLPRAQSIAPVTGEDEKKTEPKPIRLGKIDL